MHVAATALLVPLVGLIVSLAPAPLAHAEPPPAPPLFETVRAHVNERVACADLRIVVGPDGQARAVCAEHGPLPAR